MRPLFPNKRFKLCIYRIVPYLKTITIMNFYDGWVERDHKRPKYPTEHLMFYCRYNTELCFMRTYK